LSDCFANLVLVLDLQRRGSFSRGCHRRGVYRRHPRQPDVHAMPLRLQQDRPDLARGGRQARKAASQRRHQERKRLPQSIIRLLKH
jgi:hypothetical protein